MFAKDLFNKDIMFTALLLHIFFKKRRWEDVINV